MNIKALLNVRNAEDKYDFEGAIVAVRQMGGKRGSYDVLEYRGELTGSESVPGYRTQRYAVARDYVANFGEATAVENASIHADGYDILQRIDNCPTADEIKEQNEHNAEIAVDVKKRQDEWLAKPAVASTAK